MSSAVAHEAFGLSWPAPFFPFQKTGIERLLDQPCVLLADEMGLGKTVQAVAALRLLAGRSSIRHAIIVCPAGLTLQWRRHIRQWAPDLTLSTVMGTGEQRAAAWATDAAIYVTGYDSLRSDLALRSSGAPMERTWDLAVIDEAQRTRTHARMCRSRSNVFAGSALGR
jgi:SNF2 family DNA or RNA helicase